VLFQASKSRPGAPSGKADVLGLSSENVNDPFDFNEEFSKPLDHRIRWPFTELPERYTRGDFRLLLKCSAEREVFGLGKFALTVELSLIPKITPAGRETDFCAGIDDNQFSMLIEPIHVVDDEKKIIRNIGPGVVRLHLFDPLSDLSICDCLYFSFVSLNFLFLNRFLLKDRKLDEILSGDSRCAVGEVPNNMIETGPQMMDHFSRENAESRRDTLISVIRNGLLPNLVIWIGNDWVLATFNEDSNLGLKIDDILIGPL
jgi:hypothetical protein